MKKRINPFIDALSHPKQGDIGLIAEIKLKSPSQGALRNGNDVATQSEMYQSHHADAVSVVTNEEIFGGSLELFKEVRSIVSVPMLLKDFIITSLQVHQAAEYGAQAVLVLASLKDQFDPQIIDEIVKCNMVPVVEISDEKDLQIPFVREAASIGVNARNLNTFEVDVEKACALIKKVSLAKTVIGFSGIESRKEVDLYKEAGADAVLVGTALMTHAAPGQLIRSLKHIKKI